MFTLLRLVLPHSVGPVNFELVSRSSCSPFVTRVLSIFWLAIRVCALRASFLHLLASRAPGTPVPSKAGYPTGLPEMAGQQRPGPTTPDPEPQANQFSPFSGGSQYRSFSATSQPQRRLYEHTLLPAARFCSFHPQPFFLFSFSELCC